MNVHAIIRPQSTVHNLWRKQNRTFGALGNNRFVWKGTLYELQELTDLDFLTKHPDVQVEIMGKITPKSAVPFIDNTVETNPEVAPKRRGRPPRIVETDD